MDYLQYFEIVIVDREYIDTFKPYYKWITFNTKDLLNDFISVFPKLLNLIINGLPSIL